MARLLLAAALVLLIGGIVAAVSAPGASYSWQHNMLSDLGDATCRSWQEWWICSPRYAWFNASWVAAGALLSLAAIRLRHRWGAVLAGCLAVAGVGVLLVGAFPSDTAHDLHMVGAVAALPVLALGVLFSAVRPGRTQTVSPPLMRGILGGVASTACLVHLIPAGAPLSRGAAEVVALGALVVFLGVEAAAPRAARGYPRRDGAADARGSAPEPPKLRPHRGPAADRRRAAGHR